MFSIFLRYMPCHFSIHDLAVYYKCSVPPLLNCHALSLSLSRFLKFLISVHPSVHVRKNYRFRLLTLMQATANIPHHTTSYV